MCVCACECECESKEKKCEQTYTHTLTPSVHGMPGMAPPLPSSPPHPPLESLDSRKREREQEEVHQESSIQLKRSLCRCSGSKKLLPCAPTCVTLCPCKRRAPGTYVAPCLHEEGGRVRGLTASAIDQEDVLIESHGKDGRRGERGKERKLREGERSSRDNIRE